VDQVCFSCSKIAPSAACKRETMSRSVGLLEGKIPRVGVHARVRYLAGDRPNQVHQDSTNSPPFGAHFSTRHSADQTEHLPACRIQVRVPNEHWHGILVVSLPEIRCVLRSPPSTDTGFFEEVLYRYDSNASNPSCITARISWQHGTYGLNDNGSMTLYPFPTDGRIQVQDPCASVTNVITEYNQQVMFADWGITIDGQTANYVLKLNRFDGAKLPPVSCCRVNSRLSADEL
jgi:hypothetical protein